MFNQVTLGVEALSEIWDYRTNFYIPLSHSRILSPHKTERKRIVYRGHTEYFTVKKEIPLRGIDFEIGRRVPCMESLRL